jgi:hypothetical protein
MLQGTVTIELGREHGEPSKLVKAAIHKKTYTRSGTRRTRDDRYNGIWCVMDVEHPDPHPCLDEALSLAKKNGISVAMVNPCFELWILLHYEYICRPMTTKGMCDALTAIAASGYSNASSSPDRKVQNDAAILDRLPTAVTNATRLRAECASGVLERDNPGTNVDVLIELLKSPNPSKTRLIPGSRACIPIGIESR